MAVTNKRGIFSLLDVRERQATGNWPVRSDVWLAPSPFGLAHPFGYFSGGAPASLSVRRIDFSNDTATALAKGSLVRRRHASVGNQNFGYVGGGNYSSAHHSTVERIDYGNDTATAVAKGPLAAASSYLAAVGNSDFGYFVAGGPAPISTVSRIDYSNDTATASPRGNISSARDIAGTGNQNFGYVGAQGGLGPTAIFRIDYSNDSASPTPKGPLNTGRTKPAATGNADFGYWGGGVPHPSNPDATAVVDRIDYSNDTATASPKGPLSAARKGLAAAGNTSFGYFAGGQYSPSLEYTLVDRIDYSNDTATAAAKGPLNTSANVNFEFAGMSAKSNAITTNTLFPASSDQRPNVISQGTDTGYVSTGSSPAFTGGVTSKAERIDYSNDTATATAAGNATPGGLASTAGTGNANFGYTTGGFKFPSGRSYVTRLDYFNDTAVQSPKGPLSAARYDHAATGNADFGYIIAGRNPSGIRITSVDRIDYSNDTPNASPVGPIDISRDKATATGNADFGYVAGGGFPLKSTIERIIYANDTATAVIRSNLPSNSNGRGAAGTRDYGYWGGGAGPGILSRVDRLDYSNDTTNAVTKGPLSAARYSNFGNSSTTHGYFGGGTDPAYLTSIDRIDFSSDTTTASPKGNLIDARRFMASFSSRSNAIPPKIPGIK
jgi:hypothetical protein